MNNITIIYPGCSNQSFVINGVTIQCMALRLIFEAIDHNPNKKIHVIKIVRAFTGLGLKESKDIVDLYMSIYAASKFFS